MAAIDSITVGNLCVYEVDADPSVSGVVANIGDLALLKDGSNAGIWLKTGGTDTSWEGVKGEYSDGGEARGKDRKLGNTDAFDLSFITNNTDRLVIDDAGLITFKHPSDSNADIVFNMSDPVFGGFSISKPGTSGFFNLMPNSTNLQWLGADPTAPVGTNKWFLDVDNQGEMYLNTLPGAGAGAEIIATDGAPLRPDNDNTSDLGKSDKRWKNVYAASYFGDGSNLTGISAVGSIDDLTDVDTTTVSPISGDTLEWDGSNWVPQSILNGFTIFPIWAEENGGITNGQYEWSWGNGATGSVIGIVIPFDCELFAVTFQSENFPGTSVSIDTEFDSVIVDTSVFTSGNAFQNITAVQLTAGQRLGFRTNTVVGTAPTDVRVCAWMRVKATAAFPTPDRSVVDNSSVAFTSGTFADIPGMSTTVNLSDTGTVDGILNYSALRSGASNAISQFRVVINADNGQTFFDTLSTFNDNGSCAHFVESLPAGTYTVKAQAQVDQPITITSISLTATAVED